MNESLLAFTWFFSFISAICSFKSHTLDTTHQPKIAPAAFAHIPQQILNSNVMPH